MLAAASQRRYKLIRHILLLTTAAIALLPSLSTPAPAEMKEIRRVLIFNDLGSISSPGFAAIDSAILTGLEKSPYQIEFYNENLETTLFSEEASQKAIRSWYTRKYQDRRPDVIIAVGRASIQYMLESHNESFPNTPIIFCGSTEEMVKRVEGDPSFTGVWAVAEPKKTLELALRLLPATKHVVVVGGVAAFDRDLENTVKEALRSYKSTLDITYLTDLDMPTLLGRLGNLPANTVVIHTSIMKDAAGNRFIDATQSVPMVAKAANAPVFVIDDVDLGRGSVGGYLVSWEDTGEIAAEMAVRVLNGAKPHDIPVVRSSNTYMFDWRALRRWRLKESELPPGSVVRNREATVWERGRKYFLAGITVIVLQSLLIFSLFLLRSQKKKKEAELRRSEEKFSKAFRESPLSVAISRIRDSTYVDVNETFEREIGWKREEVIGRTPFEIQLWENPDGRLAVSELLSKTGHVRDLEFRIRRKNGEIRTYLGSAELIDVDGEPCALSVAADITERKAAEEAVASLSGRLIHAQEDERRRIAREIHDDYQQRLALVANELDFLSSEAGGPDMKQRIRQLWDKIVELAGDMHSLSHRLHSSTLETLGLAAGVRTFCEEFEQQHGVQVGFESTAVPRRIPPDSALCIFRVAQEALRNVKRHSGASRADVKLEWTGESLHLTVSDCGTGFDPKMLSADAGIGIRSMEERLRLVGGKLELHSQRSHGTTIEAWVPLKVAGQTAS